MPCDDHRSGQRCPRSYRRLVMRTRASRGRAFRRGALARRRLRRARRAASGGGLPARRWPCRRPGAEEETLPAVRTGPRALSAGWARYNPPRSTRARRPAEPGPPWRRPDGAPGRPTPGGSVTRFQKLVAATLAMTLALVIVGVVVRATGSGLGCPDWPLLLRVVDPAAGVQGMGRVGPPPHRGDHRGHGPRRRRPRDRRPPGPSQPRRGVLRCRGPRRLPGLARPRDRPPRQLGRVGHRAPRGGDGRRRPAHLPAGPGGDTRRASPGAAAASASRSWRRSPPSPRSPCSSSGRT